MQISFIRWFLAMIFFLPFTLKSLWVYRRLLWQNLEYIIIMGLSGLALVNICVYYAGHTANAVDMSLIATLGPLLIIVLNSLFQRKIPPFRVVAGIILAFAGVLAVILHGSSGYAAALDDEQSYRHVYGQRQQLGSRCGRAGANQRL